jgi:hypothetical protein
MYPWTISDMVYKGSGINNDQRAALYFTMPDIVVHMLSIVDELFLDCKIFYLKKKFI